MSNFIIDVPEHNLEYIFDFNESLFTTYVSFKSEVYYWCKENFQKIFTSKHHIKRIVLEDGYKYQIVFEEERDAILFKLRWIG